MTEKLLVMTEEGKKAFLVKPQALLVDAMQDNNKNLVEGTQADIACYEAVFAAMTEVDLDAIASEWLADETDKSFTEILLAHMEGK